MSGRCFLLWRKIKETGHVTLIPGGQAVFYYCLCPLFQHQLGHSRCSINVYKCGRGKGLMHSLVPYRWRGLDWNFLLWPLPVILIWNPAWLEALSSQRWVEMGTDVRKRSQKTWGRGLLLPPNCFPTFPSALCSGRFQKPCGIYGSRHWLSVLGGMSGQHCGRHAKCIRVL